MNIYFNVHETSWNSAVDPDSWSNLTSCTTFFANDIMEGMQFTFKLDPKIVGLIDKDKDFRSWTHIGAKRLAKDSARSDPDKLTIQWSKMEAWINSSLQFQFLIPWHRGDISDNNYDDDLHIHIHKYTYSIHIYIYIYISYAYGPWYFANFFTSPLLRFHASRRSALAKWFDVTWQDRPHWGYTISRLHRTLTRLNRWIL